MKHKLEKLRQLMMKNNLDAVFISTPANITYITDFDFLVDTDREGFLLITKNTEYIITSQLYRNDLEKLIPNFHFLEFSSAGGKSFWEFIDEILAKENTLNPQSSNRMGFEPKNITVAEYVKLKTLKVHLVPIDVDEIRHIKTPEEIERIATACSLGDAAFSYILKQIKPGMTEKEVKFLLDSYIRKNGAEPSFTTIVAFGKSAATPHHTITDTKLQKKDIILLDFGVQYKNYCSDMTRTIFVGKPTKEEKKVYKTVRISQQKALDYIFKQTIPLSAKNVDKEARDYIVNTGYPAFPHSLGHSIGIEVHDGFRLSPVSDTKLTEGMVFSVEPGIYLKNDMGVRIEDIVALTKQGPKILTTSNKEIIVL